MPHSTDGLIVRRVGRDKAADATVLIFIPFVSSKPRMPHSTDGFIVRRVGREKAADATVLIFIASTRFMLPFHFIVPKNTAVILRRRDNISAKEIFRAPKDPSPLAHAPPVFFRGHPKAGCPILRTASSSVGWGTKNSSLPLRHLPHRAHFTNLAICG